MIAWNSQMALDARHHLFYQDAEPQGIWRVTNEEDKTFILKLYEVEDGTNAVEEGQYFESVHVENEEDYDTHGPESGTEWAYVETSSESFLSHYDNVEELR